MSAWLTGITGKPAFAREKRASGRAVRATYKAGRMTSHTPLEWDIKVLTRLVAADIVASLEGRA